MNELPLLGDLEKKMFEKCQEQQYCDGNSDLKVKQIPIIIITYLTPSW